MAGPLPTFGTLPEPFQPSQNIKVYPTTDTFGMADLKGSAMQSVVGQKFVRHSIEKSIGHECGRPTESGLCVQQAPAISSDRCE
jgi:hypothetical protein